MNRWKRSVIEILHKVGLCRCSLYVSFSI